MRNPHVSKFDPFIFAAVTIAILVVLIIMSGGLQSWQDQMRARGHAEVRARTDLVIISSATRRLTIRDPTAVSARAIDSMDSKSLYALLSATNGYGVRLLQHSDQWDSRKDFVDPWGRPIQVRAIITGTNRNGAITLAEATIKLWSVGPNGRNENGGGDDIVGESFQIEFRN